MVTLILSLALLFISIVVGVFVVASLIYDRLQIKKGLATLSVYDGSVILEHELANTRLLQRLPLLFSTLARFGERLNPASMTDKLKRQLAYAGIPRGLEKLLAIKVICLLGGFLGALVMTAIIHIWSVQILLIVLLPVFSFFLPDLWLRIKSDARQKQIGLSLPGVLDLLAVSVEAGLGFDAALAKVIKNMSGPLSEEFARMLKEIQMGAGRKDAFKSLGERTTLPELKSFLTAMIQADIFGVSIAETLKIQAESMRVKRQQKAEEIAQKAPVKLVFPTIFCIFPALFVVLLGPAAIRIYNVFAK